MTDRIGKILDFLKASPNDCFLHHALALEYVKGGDEANARQQFEINLANDPGYIATYYHLGKLLDRIGERENAIAVFEKGMEQSKAAKDMHTYSELQSAYEDIVD